MTSNDPTQTNTKPIKGNKIILKAGSFHKNSEINDKYLDEIFDNNDI